MKGVRPNNCVASKDPYLSLVSRYEDAAIAPLDNLIQLAHLRASVCQQFDFQASHFHARPGCVTSAFLGVHVYWGESTWPV
jgi:hypothetical protein